MFHRKAGVLLGAMVMELIWCVLYYSVFARAVNSNRVGDFYFFSTLALVGAAMSGVTGTAI